MEKKFILVVDDDPVNTSMFVELLKDNYRVEVALNGEDALSIARSEPHPQLILLDIVMPDLSGLEVCKILKEQPETADIPIVFLSGLAGEEDCEKGMELGGAAYLQKPIEPKSLFSLMEILLFD